MTSIIYSYIHPWLPPPPPYIQGVYNNKPKCLIKSTTVIDRSMFISQVFWRSRHRCKNTFRTAHTTAGRQWQSSAVMDLVTPNHIFFSGSPGPDFGLPEPPSLWGKKKKKKKKKVQQIRWVPQHLDIVSSDLVLDSCSHVHGRIVLIQPPLVCCQIRLLFPQTRQKTCLTEILWLALIGWLLGTMWV